MSPMEVIKKLFGEHFFDRESGFEWSYQEGVSLNEVDPELCKAVNHLLNLEHDEKPV